MLDQAEERNYIVKVNCHGCQYEETRELSIWEVELQHTWCPKCSRKLWLTAPELDKPSSEG